MASIDYVDEIEVSETHVSNMIQYDTKGIIGLNWISVGLDHFKKGMWVCTTVKMDRKWAGQGDI